MSQVKRHLEDISVKMGLGGLITNKVIERSIELDAQRIDSLRDSTQEDRYEQGLLQKEDV